MSPDVRQQYINRIPATCNYNQEEMVTNVSDSLCRVHPWEKEVA